MKTFNNKLRRSIMRRVYYAYGLSIASNPMLLHGMALSISLAIFAQMVHVASLINNLLHTEVESVPHFIWSAFARGEVLTIIAVGVMVFTALSFPWHLARTRMPKLQYGRVLSH